jgi:hypothetical protein
MRISRTTIDAVEGMHYHLQLGGYFTSTFSTDSFGFAYSDVVNDFIWNHAWLRSVNAKQVEELIKVVISFYNSRKRRPCVYVPVGAKVPHLLATLNRHGFKNVDKEAWMFYSGRYRNNKLDRSDLKIVRVTNERTLRHFIKVLRECFPRDYGNAVRREFQQFQIHKTVLHLIAFSQGKAVGIGSLYTSDRYSVIHNMGTVTSRRNQGIADAVLHNLVLEFQKTRGSLLYLQSLGEGPVEDFYAKRGFETRWRRSGYLLEPRRAENSKAPKI